MFFSSNVLNLQGYANIKKEGDFKIGNFEQEFYPPKLPLFFNASDLQIV